MKKKKLLSVILASALAVSVMPFQAFATEVGPSTTVGGTIGGDSTIASSAVIRGVVPRDFDFIVNPLELSVPGSGTAQIISTPYTFQNMSNMDVQLSVTPVFVTTDGVHIASSPDEIKNVPGEEPTIFMQVAPAAEKPTLTGTPGSLDFASGTSLAFASGDGISMTVSGTADAANTAYFKLKNLKNAYTTDGITMTYDPTKNTIADTDAVGFTFTGKVSQLSKWDNPDIKLGVSVEYAFDFISSDSFADPDKVVTGTYQMLKENLAVSGPVFNLSKDGKISITNIPEGYKPTKMGYIIDGTSMSVSKADIETAISADGVVGAVIGSYTTKEMVRPTHFDWDSTTNTGSLVTTQLHNKYLYIFTILHNETDGKEDIAIVSPMVLMD